MIGLSQARAQALLAAGQLVPNPVVLRGLIDTGASCTCVDPDALSGLGLAPTGVTQVLTPSTGNTPHQTNTYDVSLSIPSANGGVYIPNLPITESSLGVQGIQALIGRDVLAKCIFIYNGQNVFFSLAY